MVGLTHQAINHRKYQFTNLKFSSIRIPPGTRLFELSKTKFYSIAFFYHSCMSRKMVSPTSLLRSVVRVFSACSMLTYSITPKSIFHQRYMIQANLFEKTNSLWCSQKCTPEYPLLIPGSALPFSGIIPDGEISFKISVIFPTGSTR